MIGHSRNVAAPLGALLLAACGAGGDQDPPATPLPAQTAVLQGTVTGLGTRRPVVLQYDGTDTCIDSAAPTGPRVECRFYGVLNQSTSAFSFGSLPVGTPYNVTVKTQPFGKQCTVARGAGTLVAADTAIAVSCVNDSTPRFLVRGSVAPAVAALPGAKVILTTEEGMQEKALNGQTTFQFDQALFNSQSSLPVFGWTVTALHAGSDGKVNNCSVANGTNVGVDGVASSPPTGDVTNVQVTACSFAVTVTAAYSGTPAQAMGAGGVTLELRDPRTGEKAVFRDAATGLDVAVPPLNLAAFASATFARQLLSNSSAIYDLVITSQPAGQTCVVGSTSQLTQGSAVLLLNPLDSTHGFFTSKSVRCRASPPAGSQLKGIFQQSSITGGVSTYNRNFLAFFDDGTFLFGLHATGGNCSASCGVEHGFYAYNSAAGTIAFTPLTDTLTGTNTNRLSTGGATGTLTGVARTSGSPAQITATFNASTNWLLTAPVSIPGQMTGTWATADHRRIWIFEAARYTGFHAGVNGLGNAQDACFAIEDPALLSGYFTRRGNGSTCQLGNGPSSSTSIFTLDVPSSTTTPRVPEGYVGKWPQGGSNADGRPSSPVLYTIAPRTPDRLTIQNTQHDGTPVDPPILLFRDTVD